MEEPRRYILDYFQTNKGSVSSLAALWEAHKAVIRGQCIAMGTRAKKDVALQVETLSTQLWAPEEKLSDNPSKRPLRRILEVCSKLKTGHGQGWST